VLDASVVVRSCAQQDGFARFGKESLVAPALMWSESLNAVHEAFWRREITAEVAARILVRLRDAPVEKSSPPGLDDEAWRVAEELGWAKTYDSEYVALARLLQCRLVSLDMQLRRGTARMGFVIGPDEL
jgi:predicted nucleic acid-binding protein